MTWPGAIKPETCKLNPLYAGSLFGKSKRAYEFVLNDWRNVGRGLDECKTEPVLNSFAVEEWEVAWQWALEELEPPSGGP